MISIRRRLATKFSLSVLLIAVPIFILSLGVFFLQSRYFIREQATSHANSVLNTMLQRVRMDMNTIETAVNANEWLVGERLEPQSLASISYNVVSLNSHVNSCSIIIEPNVITQDGRFFSVNSVRSGDSVITVRESECDYSDKVQYKTPRRLGYACWIEPSDDNNERTPYSTELTASYCKPVYRADGRFVGVISASLSLPQLAQTINEVALPYSDAYFTIIDNEGHYLIHPDSTRLFHKTIFSDADPHNNADLIALGHEMTAGNQGVLHIVIDNKPCMVCYCPISGTDWSLALVCPENQVLRSYHRLAYIITGVIVIGLFVILLLCHSVITRAIRPLNRLLRLSKLITDGQYDEVIPPTRREDVIGRLQNNFAAMQQSLNFHLGSVRYTMDRTHERNEELDKATHLAEESVRQKTTFIQNITHQIRTPLNIIMGFAQVLCDSFDTSSPDDAPQSMLSNEEVASIANMMTHNSALLSRMVLMLFDSSDTGISEELKNQKNDIVSCNQLARECISYMKKLFPDVSVSMNTDVSDDFSILTTHVYLMRGLRELLYNAAKYSDGQNVSLSILLMDTTIRFIVQDTGPGIAEEYREQIYQSFAKVNDLSEGLGLGLPLSKRHVLGLGGDLTLDTSYHDGCRFILELPR
ncbi:MAG: histidine kinase [Prevotella sp.]|nr:histidine kinase [Prevotella sp.]